ncbi:MAG: cytochrome-c peroxidase [Candidatus Eisenbacteria bacterium]|nr:cytochrome-c peroxidase [Candidatus Eisenbacteria bacterium]
MKRIHVFLAVVILFVPLLVLAADNSPQPLTGVEVHSLGPQKLGNLPQVSVPADNPQTGMKIMLGKQLYFDTRLSKDNTISCATCHDPLAGWADKGPTSEGIGSQRGGRRAPPVSNAAYLPLQFWDGRAPSLEEQAKGPIQNPVEMGNTHEQMLRTVGDIPGYVEEFKNVFGTTPVTIDQVAQAIAAFERTVITTDSPFDRLVKGDDTALTPLEKQGLEIFNGKAHCTACHWGGHFTDGRFHNLGVTQSGPLKVDDGRSEITKNPKDTRAFKTPTVRDAALRPPYMHTGGEKTLTDVVNFYNKGGGTRDAYLDRIMVPLGLTDQEVSALVAFMTRAMTSLNPEVAAVTPIPASVLPK